MTDTTYIREGGTGTTRTRFAEHVHTEAGITLTADASADEALTAQTLMDGVFAAHVPVNRTPKNVSEVRAALRNTRGEADNGVRVVHIDYTMLGDPRRRTGGNVFDIVGPKSGEPIIVKVTSGLPRLHVKSGYAIIEAKSGWGNSITVEPGATAAVICGYDTKVGIDAEPGTVVDIFSDSSRGFWSAKGDAQVTVHGDTSNTVYTDADRDRSRAKWAEHLAESKANKLEA